MPVLFQINVACNYGATGRITEQIGLAAKKAGWDCYIAHSARNKNTSQLNTIQVTSTFEEIQHFAAAVLFDKHGLSSTHATHALVKRIKKIKPDIIHLHNIHGYYLNFKVLFTYLAQADISVVWTMHDCWSFTARCFHFQGIGCEKWKTGCTNCKSPKGYTVSYFLDRSKSLYGLKKQLFSSISSMTMVPVCHWIGDFLKDSYLSGYPVQVIHNGTDVSTFFPHDSSRLRSKLRLNNRFVILGVAAPWNGRKGLYDFFKLARLLGETYQIILVGLKPDQIEKLPQGVIGVTRTESPEELAELYSLADVFVNPTYLDTFPTVNIEALACGTPVITYKTGGCAEGIDENTGLVIEQGGVNGIAEAIKTVERNGKAYYTEACRNRAIRCFNIDDRSQDYIRLYSQILRLQNR